MKRFIGVQALACSRRWDSLKAALHLAGCLLLVLSLDASAGEANPPPPVITQVTVSSNSQRQITWTPYPAAQEFRILSTTNLGQPFIADGSGTFSGYGWSAPLFSPSIFHCLEVVPLSSNALLSATVLNRLTYGPTSSEIERIAAIGPQAYINDQLAGETIVENIDTAAPITNAPPPPRYTNFAVAAGWEQRRSWARWESSRPMPTSGNEK